MFFWCFISYRQDVFLERKSSTWALELRALWERMAAPHRPPHPEPIPSPLLKLDPRSNQRQLGVVGGNYPQTSSSNDCWLLWEAPLFCWLGRIEHCTRHSQCSWPHNGKWKGDHTTMSYFQHSGWPKRSFKTYWNNTREENNIQWHTVKHLSLSWLAGRDVKHQEWEKQRRKREDGQIQCR